MKKSTSAFLSLLVLSLVLGGAYFFSSGDQLQGRFSNLNLPANSPVDQKTFDTKVPDSFGGVDLDISDFADAVKPYFEINSYISSHADLDSNASESDSEIVGHLVFDFTEDFLAAHGDGLVDIDFGGAQFFLVTSGTDYTNRVSAFFDDNNGMDVIGGSYAYATTGEKVTGIDPTDGSFTIEFWVNPASARTDEYTEIDPDEEYFLAWDDVFILGDRFSYQYFADERSGNENNRFEISDTYSSGGEDYIRSLMTFSVE